VDGRAIIVMAKEPEAGRVKTRLCPPLCDEEAARLHEAFLVDMLQRLRSQGYPVRVYGTGSSMSRLAALVQNAGAALSPQCEGALGRRMAAALAKELARSPRVLVLGADTPDLPLSYVADAFTALDGSDLCLGPATDGGYYLLGAKGSVPSMILDDAIPWGSSRVLAVTRQRLAAADVGHTELAPWSDVDDVEGLRGLADRLSAAGAPELPRTRGLLADFVRTGRLL